MLSRALSLATVALLIGCFAAIPVQAQNLEAGKSPSQIFAGTCSACHKSPRGLLKTVPARALPGHVRAGRVAQWRGCGPRGRPPVPPKNIPKPETQPQQAERPDDGDELPPQAEPRRQGRNAKRLAHPAEGPDAAKPAVEGRAPAHAASERAPEGRKSAAKQRLS